MYAACFGRTPPPQPGDSPYLVGAMQVLEQEFHFADIPDDYRYDSISIRHW